MPNFNHGHFLEETIEAILSQSLQPIEIIIIDDASTDDSVEIIQKYIKSNKNICLFENKNNMGAIYNTIKYLHRIRGEYFYVMGADDKVLPGLFEKSVDFLRKYPHAGYCCSDSILEYIDEPGYYKKNNTNLSDEPCYIDAKRFERLLKTRNPRFTGQSVVYNKTIFINSVSFLPELRWENDLFALYVLGLRYGLCYIPKTMSIVRVSSKTQYAGQAARQPKIRREVLSHIIDLIESPKYMDVSDSFRRSGILCRNNTEILYVLSKKKKLFKYLNYVLIKRALFHLLRDLIVLNTPKRVKHLYHKRMTIKPDMN